MRWSFELQKTNFIFKQGLSLSGKNKSRNFWCRSRNLGAQRLSGRVLDPRPRGRGFKSHCHHCVVSLSKTINPSLVLVLPRKTRPYITERLLMGRKESNQTNKSQGNLENCRVAGSGLTAGRVIVFCP